MRRARQLAVALRELGLERGDRVATLCWNHHQHLEAYFGIPCGGFVLHTLNLRLHPNDLAYIANHAGDRAVIVDRSLLPLLEQFKDRTQIEHVFVVEDSYEELLAGADAGRMASIPELDENEAAAMCYTSGTTGLPKGVVVLAPLDGAAHARRRGEQSARARHLRDRHDPAGRADVPRERVGLPVPRDDGRREARLSRARTSIPRACSTISRRRSVTWAAGVPTIWMGILQLLDANPGRWDISAIKAMLVGGSAVPRALIAAFKQRHGIPIVQGWGMTETSPVASTACLPHDLADARRGASAST